MPKIIINGKFYAQRTTGVQRYARELLLALDKIVDLESFFLALPSDAVDVPNFKNIQLIQTKIKASLFWDQIYMPLLAIKNHAFGLHLCHVAPIFKPDFVCIHDMNVERNPQWFTKKLVLWYWLVHKACSLMAKKIYTISEFSKHEIRNVLNTPEDKIVNIGSGWQHIKRVAFDEGTLERYGLTTKGFYFSLGTRAPHKNMRWVCEYARLHQDECFVISGSMDRKIFGNDELDFPRNVRFLGYLSDSEIKTLMRECKAFVFPSFYEGFGLPPLEALSVGAKSVVADIPVMHEILGENAFYIDFQNETNKLDEIISSKILDSTLVLEKYNWDYVARRVSENLRMWK